MPHLLRITSQDRQIDFEMNIAHEKGIWGFVFDAVDEYGDFFIIFEFGRA